MAETGGKFPDRRHNMAVAMQNFRDSSFLHDEMLEVNGDSGKNERRRLSGNTRRDERRCATAIGILSNY